jgi:hypothetical protein
MSLQIDTILDKLVSHALTLGVFEKVNTSEPKSAVSSGLTGAIWVQAIAPVPVGSGLASTTKRVEFSFRLYTRMTREPQDSIDPMMIKAVDLLMDQYESHFSLDGNVKMIDLLGQAGTPLSAQAGYINQDGKVMRVITLTVPVVVNDVSTQAA